MRWQSAVGCRPARWKERYNGNDAQKTYGRGMPGHQRKTAKKPRRDRERTPLRYGNIKNPGNIDFPGSIMSILYNKNRLTPEYAYKKWAYPIGCTIIPPDYRVGSSSVWPWHGPLPIGPPFSLPMNLPGTWTSRPKPPPTKQKGVLSLQIPSSRVHRFKNGSSVIYFPALSLFCFSTISATSCKSFLAS